MAFGFDDAALGAVKEVVSEAAKELSEEVGNEAIESVASNNSFSPSNFNKAPESAENKGLGIKESFNTDISINDEFAPDKFNDVTDSQNSDNEISEEFTVSIERTSTFEEQTIDNSKLEDMRPAVNERLDLGKEHDGEVLRKNLEEVTGQNPEASNAHHIVGNDTPKAAEILDKYNIDRNDPANGIFLPDSPESPLMGSVHGQGRHMKDYSDEVEQRFAGVSSREEALEVLQSLKEDLYSGDLPLHYDVEPNKLSFV